MIRLTNTTTDLLACTPSSTNVVKTMVSFTDVTASAWVGNSEPHSLAAATKATICATPAASTVREIDHVTISASGGANTVIVLQTISATDYQLISVALLSGETLEYTHATGWRVTDSGGNIKTVIGGAVAATTLSASGATTLDAVTASGLGTFNAGLVSGSVGGTLGSLALKGTTSGTATFSTDATVTKVTLDKPLDLGSNSLTSGAISGTNITGNNFYTLATATTVGQLGNANGLIIYGSTGTGGGDINKTKVFAGTSLVSEFSSTGLSVTGTGSYSALGAFATSDKYVVIDSSGNLHKSALGPLS